MKTLLAILLSLIGILASCRSTYVHPAVTPETDKAISTLMAPIK